MEIRPKIGLLYVGDFITITSLIKMHHAVILSGMLDILSVVIGK